MRVARYWRGRIGLCAAVLLGTGMDAAGAQQPLLKRLIERGRHPAIRWGRLGDVQADATRLYGRNDWLPLWVAHGRPTRVARALIDVLATAGDRGLQPEDYDAAQLAALAATLERRGADAEQEARFDAALTVAALRFVGALARGRGAPAAQRSDGLTREGLDRAAFVERLRGTLEPGPLLTGLEPTWSYYLALRRALGGYRALLRDSASWRLPRPRTSGVHEGEAYSGAARLRRLLLALGDLGPQASPPADDSVFSSELAEALRRFQVRQGVHVDGILSEASWRLLSGHLPRRIRQMELALERWRRLPRELDDGTAPLFVSLPARRLYYLMPLRNGPAQLIRMSVTMGGACRLDNAALGGRVNGLLLHPSERGLGTVLFRLSGDDRVYLHGSSAADSFEDTSGCIRAADAELLAGILLRDQPDWTLERIHAAMAGTQPVHVRLRRQLAVLVVYGTAIASEHGQVFFQPDAEGSDRKLEAELARGPGG